MNNLDSIIKTIINNTVKKNSSRDLDILSIANNIKAAEEITGSLKKVAELVGLSEVMLKKFLCALDLSEPIKKLIQERKLDKVQIIYTIRNLSVQEQKTIANLVQEKKLNTQDIKALIPLRNKLKERPLNEVVERLMSTKDIRVFVAYIKVNKKLSKREATSLLMRTFEEDEIHQIEIQDDILRIDFTRHGFEKLKSNAKALNQKKETYLNTIING